MRLTCAKHVEYAKRMKSNVWSTRGDIDIAGTKPRKGPLSQTIFRTPMVIQSTSTVLTNSDFLSPKRRIAKTLRQSGHAGSFAVLLFSLCWDLVVFLSHSSSDKRGLEHKDKAIRDATHSFTSDHSTSTAHPLGKNGRLRAFPGALCEGTTAAYVSLLNSWAIFAAEYYSERCSYFWIFQKAAALRFLSHPKGEFMGK